MKDRVSILGTEYTVQMVSYEDDPRFEARGCAAYMSWATHSIVLCDMRTCPVGWCDALVSEEGIDAQHRANLRHEIIHAFLDESGLGDSGHRTAGSWSTDEEIVDWFTLQGEKIWKAWAEVGALDANAPIPHPECYTDSDVEEDPVSV